MKVLYLTVPPFFDLEISLIRELSRYVDVKVVLVVSPQSMKSSAFSIDSLEKRCDLYSANNYPPILKYSHLIDTNIWYVANNPDGKMGSYYKLSKSLKKFIEEESFDLIHTTTSNKLSLFLLPYIKRFPNKILTVHDPVTHYKFPWYRRQLTTCFRNIHKNILILSPSHLDDIRRQDPLSKWIVYQSRLGVYDFLRSYKVSENLYGKYILFFGRIAEYKGVDILVKSYLKSQCISNGIKLLIAGAGDINTSKELLGCDNIIQLNRYIENDELATLIQHSIFTVMPYKSATQSGVLMSAYAFNKPVIATEVGDFPNTIVHGKTGVLVPPNDEDALTNSIDWMLQQDMNIMSDNINKSFSDEDSESSWGRIAYNLSETYKKILNLKHE